MKFIVANKDALIGLSSRLYDGPPGRTRYSFKVWDFGGVGYAVQSDEVEAAINFPYRIVDSLPDPEAETMPCVRCGVEYETLSNGVCQFCEASETQPIDRKTRQARIDYLSTQFKDTPIGQYIDALFDRYAVQEKQYVEHGTSDLAIAVANEDTAPFTNYLNIKIPTERMGEITVKHGILMNIFIEPSFVLGGEVVNKADLFDNLSYSHKTSRNLNTAMDAYFTYNGQTYGIRFQDWAFWHTLSDDECWEKIQDYIFKNTSIEHPAA